MVFEGASYNEFIEEEEAVFYFIALLITSVISLFFHAIYYYKELQKNKVKEQKVIAGTASAKFDALKNQLDPHFLFNSLNVLTSLIDENPDNAQKFTTSLSKVYRYVLEQKNKDMVTVDEELAFAKTYMSLLKMRFEDSIIFDIPDRASNLESKVVPLSLQLLLENAVKHNMVTSSKPLHIKIYEEGNALVIANNLQPKQIVKKSSGVGLSNIKQRYSLLTDRKLIINQNASSFAVAKPSCRVPSSAICLIPLQCAFLPFVNEPHHQDAEKQHHGPEAKHADFIQDDGPGKQKGDFKVKNYEKYCYQVIADIKFHARVFEGFEAAFVWGKFLFVGAIGSQCFAGGNGYCTQSQANENKQQDWQVIS